MWPVMKNETMDGPILTLFLWDSLILWMFDEAWVMQGHDVSQCNVATIISAVESVV